MCFFRPSAHWRFFTAAAKNHQLRARPYTIDSQQSRVYAAIMTLWLVGLPGFLNISHFPGMVNVMSLVITAAPSLLILRSLEAIIIAQWAQ